MLDDIQAQEAAARRRTAALTSATRGRTRASRPKILDVGGGEVEIRGYHATRRPEGWTPHKNYELHMGSQLAALDRMKVVKPSQNATGFGYRTEVDPNHGLFEVRVRGPRDTILGLQRGIGDEEANSLGGIRRGYSPSQAVIEKYPEHVTGVTQGRTRAIGYKNVYEDPGSRSWVVTSPESITEVRRIYDAGSTTMGLMGLLGTAAQFIPGFAERFPRTNWLANGGPVGDWLTSVINSNYAPGGVMDPYRDLRNMPGFNPATGSVPA